ncbi:hypothetical protein ASPBRDRAFT_358331 [Aspergillus brasiliensis CBS 101740]|uniref:Uncharacterized protein n=1 Tax=Aspergillus brasiliensis (strain CBS 101740 / IMI 381727 / IBT 21946) TaxID=767769 RepID=A0A1L9U5L2_ASPBC|nr:hypothetical protein ASPBRDRAFT_358331 [Aspergillus brasiliensis CBS 101740]
MKRVLSLMSLHSSTTKSVLTPPASIINMKCGLDMKTGRRPPGLVLCGAEVNITFDRQASLTPKSRLCRSIPEASLRSSTEHGLIDYHGFKHCIPIG